jgi:RNA polymerase sigma-70 factor (ECF subfamily)
MDPDNDAYAAMTNRELLKACVETMTAEAWQEFVRRFEPIIAGGIARIARSYGHISPDLVLDLTQEVYLKLCKDEFRLLKNLKITYDRALFSYLKLVAMSVTHDHFRKNRPNTETNEFCNEISEARADIGITAAPTAEQRIFVQEITAIVEKITAGPNAARDRLVFWLCHRDGFTANAIASIPALHLSQKAVESILHRIRVALRDELLRMRKSNQFRRRAKADFSVS